jgi:Tfp pilus assembly protein PilO
MKVKLLFFPLSLTIALALGIWSIQPEIERSMSLREEIEAQHKKLDDINQKLKNAKTLEGELDAHSDMEQLALRYLPNVQDDERMMDSLSFLAVQSGVSLVDVKLTRNAQTAAKEVESEPTTASAVVGSGSAAAAPVVAPKAILKTVDAQATLKGGYENIRDFVSRINKTDRFQDFLEVEISRDSQTGNEEVSSDVLTASIGVRFSYFPQSRSASEAETNLFAQAALDFKPIQTLQGFISSPVPSLEIGAAGKNNPFLR